MRSDETDGPGNEARTKRRLCVARLALLAGALAVPAILVATQSPGSREPLLAVVLVIVGTVLPVLAQAPAGMKMYAFSSGPLTIAKSALQAGAPSTPIQVPVGFFVVMHPKGNLLFDTGNNDKIINDPSYWGPFAQALQVVRTPDVAIDTQLKKIGLTPNDIKYVVTSHLHLDHGGNVGKFPNSTLIVQKDEIENAFWPAPGTGGPYMIGDVMPSPAPNTTM